MSAVLGVDGARGGWAGALVTDGEVRWLTFASIAEALALDVAVVAVDMPIGLPARGRRACDVQAKRALGRAHSRVFLAPPRAVLAATSYDEAAVLHRAATGGLGLSVQTWHIVARIREVDAVAPDPRLVEVHPELSFARLAGAVLPSKHAREGRAARVDVLRGEWPGLESLGPVPRGTDALDALAAAWSGRRWLAGTHDALPDTAARGQPPYDECGRPMRIVV